MNFLRAKRAANCVKAKTYDSRVFKYVHNVVEERPVVGRSCTGRSGGRSRSENAGMSSENYVRIIMADNLRFPEEGSSAQGKPGAKARRKRVVDAHTVEIP